MDSPFQSITEAFKSEYHVNFSVERPDGSIVLTLSNQDGVAVKRFISAGQWRDPEKLRRFIMSVKFGLAIEKGEVTPALLDSMTRSQEALAS